MSKININFTEDEKSVILQSAILYFNEGLTRDEWCLLKEMIKTDMVVFPDSKTGNTKRISTASTIKKINNAVK